MFDNNYVSNPIIPGFFPDPSICRVGEDYYLVNSSFEYFPAIPVWHSKDLVNWELITNAIDSPEQGLRLDNVSVSGGVQACTIRYNNGTFYIVSTCIEKDWPSLNYNFIITAKDPRGPWSKVHYIEDAPGIDASLFFECDRCYFHANRQKEGVTDGGDTEIWIQELDLTTFKLIGDKHSLWDGTGGIFPEGPHIYKRNGYYYLLIAEGGTLHNHIVSMARSENLFGPYVSSPRNPILTHKHVHRSYPIQNVGHADIIEIGDNQWYMVCLGSRPRGGFYDGGNTKYSFGGYYRNLGRETFLVPLIWEDDWSPIIATNSGLVEELIKPPLEKMHYVNEPNCFDNFNGGKLRNDWIGIRNLSKDFYSIKDNRLYLEFVDHKINVDDIPFMIGKRQTSWDFSSTLYAAPHSSNEAKVGIALYYNYENCVEFVMHEGAIKVNSYKDGSCENVVTMIKSQSTNNNAFKFIGHDQSIMCFYNEEFIAEFDAKHLNSDYADGHTGCLVCIVALSDDGLNQSLEIIGFEMNNI